MKNKILPIVILALIFALMLFLNLRPVKNNIRFTPNIFDQNIIDTIFENTKIYPNNSELSIAVIVGENVDYLGLRKEGNSVFSVTNADKIFEIGSISKVFLASLLVRCLQENLLNLNDPIKIHLPIHLSAYEFEGEQVRIIHLANHTSGIKPLPENLFKTYEYEPSGEDEIELVSDYLKLHCDYQFKPGTKYEYSNLGMALLGMIVCDKLGRSYEQLVREIITGPLGMKNTVLHVSKSQKQKMVTGFDQQGKIAPLIASELYACSGGLKSTAGDLVKFLNANIYDTDFFSVAHQKTFEIDNDYDVALGWQYSKMHKEKVYFHHGGTVGYTSGIAFEKDNDVGMVVLSNISALLRDRPDITKLMYDMFGQIERKIAEGEK